VRYVNYVHFLRIITVKCENYVHFLWIVTVRCENYLHLLRIVTALLRDQNLVFLRRVFLPV
jgi:hypothetical protein